MVRDTVVITPEPLPMMCATTHGAPVFGLPGELPALMTSVYVCPLVQVTIEVMEVGALVGSARARPGSTSAPAMAARTRKRRVMSVLLIGPARGTGSEIERLCLSAGRTGYVISLHPLAAGDHER